MHILVFALNYDIPLLIENLHYFFFLGRSERSDLRHANPITSNVSEVVTLAMTNTQ